MATFRVKRGFGPIEVKVEQADGDRVTLIVKEGETFSCQRKDWSKTAEFEVYKAPRRSGTSSSSPESKKSEPKSEKGKA